MYTFLVEKNAADEIQSRLTSLPTPDVQDGQVLLNVSHSSLNYKDAMAATGHPGIVKHFPHIPGIDAVGVVVDSKDSRYQQGETVIAMGHELGVERWGGWASQLVAPADWLVPLPQGLSAEESMMIGTAGFTAAQSVRALLKHGLTPDAGRVLISGATGGVGSFTLMLLHKLGFQTVAVTGKKDRHDWLRSLGAAEVVGRETLTSDPQRPLLKGEFAAGVDTVGGTVLATMLKKIAYRGCVACCGVAGGSELATTVYPFILRGIALYGIDSAWCPDDLRTEIWTQLANEWKLPNLQELKVNLSLTTLNAAVQQILEGQFAGRGIIDMEHQ